MANLAIKGHATRGKEVIEILEMLGGENEQCFYGGDTDAIYYIGNNKHIWVGIECHFCTDFFYKITLEEFLEKYPFKVGDFVRVSEYDSKVCICKMRWNSIYNYMEYMVYRDGMPEWYTTKALLEYNEPNKEEIMKETNKAIFEGNAQCCNIMNDIIKDNIEERKSLLTSLIEYFQTTPKDELEREWNEHNELDEIGPTVEEYIAFAESFKKQPQYPTTYEECCSVLGMTYDYPDIQMVSIEECNLYSSFIQLIRCRNAYWKIAGGEMGLGKPWEPTMETVYCISRNDNVIKCSYRGGKSNVLEFPTEEMCNIFYENFKDLIEQCKDLL